MFRQLMQTSDDLVPLILRLVLGVIFFAHGSQKVFGWFGGAGFKGTIDGMTSGLRIPAPFVVLAMAAEFLGSFGLLFGVLSRVAALGVASVMVVAAIKVHLPHGFFANWTGQQKGEGFEFHLLALTVAIAIMIAGAGRFSVDRALTREGGPLAARAQAPDLAGASAAVRVDSRLAPRAGGRAS